MLKSKLFFGLTAMALSFVFLIGCDDDDNAINSNPATTSVRVIHASYDAPAVDVRVDGSVAITNLAYGESSGYAQLNTGSRNIAVTPAGSTTPVVINADLELAENTEYTVYAVNGLNSIEPIISVDDRSGRADKAQIRFIHASPDAPAVDIKLNSGTGSTVFSDVAFKDIEDYAAVDQGSYVFAVTPAGSSSEVVVFNPVEVQNGNLYTVIALGTLDAGDQYPFVVRVFVDNGNGNASLDLSAGSSNVMVIHASPDAPAVDLLVDDFKVNTSGLPFPQNTGYLALSAGDRNFKVNAAGTSTTVIDATATLVPNGNFSVFAVDVLANIMPLVLADDLSAPAAGKAHVRFLHLSPDAPEVDITLPDGTIVFGQYEFKESSAFTPLDAGMYDLEVRVSGTPTVALNLDNINLESGKIYTVFARGLLSGSGDRALGAEIIVNN
ncbi:MAG TPA: DUF4397 domain-containing protein [candidate division Zixibacteria bacterium]|nr:DUF4397 domain-containing protein [candidate division Zixibacteria bacterium]HEQ98078.1 DUF4397 domain-containing protein [candidate division Zixibacteria bacterium]